MKSSSGEERFQQALGRLTGVVVVMDKDFRLAHVSPEATVLMGRPTEELLGQPVWSVWPEGLRQPLRSVCERVMKHGRAESVHVADLDNGRRFEARIHSVDDGLVMILADISQAQQNVPDASMLALALELAHVGSLEWHVASGRIVLSAELCRIYGLASERRELAFADYLLLQHPDDQARIAEFFERASENHQPFEFEGRFIHPDGSLRTLVYRGLVHVNEHGLAVRAPVACQEITLRKRALQLTEGQHDILVAIAAQQPLAESLARIALLHEALNPGALCSILLLDEVGRHVTTGAAPSLPPAYSALLNGLEIGDGRGSCGTAAWRRERVVVTDIETHPYWADYKSLALVHGLKACWSTPIFGSDGRVLGTFAVYFRGPRRPRLDELASIDQMVPVASVAIESAKLVDRLRVRNSFFEMSMELFCIIDPATGRLIQFNPSLQRLTGLEPDELRRRNYRELFPVETEKDARQGAAFNDGGQTTHEFATGCVCSDGTRHTLEWISFAAPDGLLYTVARDVTARRLVEERLAHASSHDAVTGLPHHLLFERDLATILHAAPEHLSIMVIGLDHFQMVNDSIGHRTADEVLKRLAMRLRTVLPVNAHLARMAGDRFAIAVAELVPEHVRELAERIRRAVAEPLEGENYRLLLTASVGVSHYPHHGRHANDLLRRAEAAMIQAKRDGRDQLTELSVEQMVELEDRVALGSRLREAIPRGELELHYQPQHSANELALVGFEALLRWNCSQFGPFPPVRFIPIAEALGLMPEIGVWVLDSACRQARAWLDLGHRNFAIAVNVSAQQLQRPGLADSVADMLRRHDLPASMLEIEMTESSLMEDITRTQETLLDLRSLGVRLSIDDFGTGYSSLSYLRQFPVDKLKIDQSFVRRLPSDTKDAAIAGTIIALAHQLGMGVAAEGVETEAQATLLAKLGCDLLQGYYLAPALSAKEAQAYFDKAHVRGRATGDP